MLYTLTDMFPYMEICCSECIFWIFVFTYFSTGDVNIHAKFLGKVGEITQVLQAAEKRHSCECNRRYIYIYIYTRGLFKKRPNFLNRAPTSIESALRLLSAPSIRVLRQTPMSPVSL